MSFGRFNMATRIGTGVYIYVVGTGKNSSIRKLSRYCNMKGDLLVVVGKRFEFSASAGMFEFSQGFSFNLTDSFSSHLKLLPYFFQSMFVSISQAKSHLEDLGFTFSQCFKCAFDLFP